MHYAELHCKTNFSFLEGASHADELVGRAAELGYTALAVTDRNSLAGVVRAHMAAKEASLKLIIGAEITLRDAPPVVLWASDRAAYGRLSRLITRGRRRAEKGDCQLWFDDLADLHEGLIAGILPASAAGRGKGATEVGHASSLSRNNVGHASSLSRNNVGHASSLSRNELPAVVGADERPMRPSPPAPLPQGEGRKEEEENVRTSWKHVLPGEDAAALQPQLARYRELFGDRGYLLAELHEGPHDERRLEQLAQLARSARLPLVAAGDVHYHVPQRMALHEVLTAIRLGTTVEHLGAARLPNAQRHLQPIEDIALRLARYPAAIRRTLEIAQRCNFSLDELRYEYPQELAPEGMTPMQYLATTTWRGARKRYPQGVPQKVQQLIEHELQLIAELHYEAYFLTVFDMVRFARRRGILCQGRGSAANSAVCFCLGITSVDPEQTDVLFERFVSRERNEAPDIDVDFEHERREEVLQYVYEKYGRQRAGMTAVVTAYRMRSAVREVGKALGLSLDRVDRLAKLVEGHTRESHLADRCRQAGIDPGEPLGRRLIYLVNQLLGFPRHLSQHVGGMVITRGPLCELAPIENAAMEGRTVVQWDKDDLDDLGILKVDCLSLGMLTAIRKSFQLIERWEGRRWTLAGIPPGDSQVYDMICRAETMGVFQIESRAQMSMLPRLKPRCYYDLVIEVAIVRPGPIQGQMVHPYLRRRAGEELPRYPSEAIRQVLDKTLGVPIFQEQAMRLAVVAAGFTPGEADQLRRAMGAWRRPGLIDQFRQKLLRGMAAQGLSAEFAEQVFQQIRGFGEYGFPESHAASFALLVYVSAWLKYHYPAVFLASLINSQPMGFYAPAQLIREARDRGVEVRPLDVNASSWDCTLERSAAAKPAVRLGFRLLQRCSPADAERIEAARAQGGAFRSLAEFARRTQLRRAMITRLAEADALASLGRGRRQALWDALAEPGKPEDQPLFDSLAADDEPAAALPEMLPEAEVHADYAACGVSLRNHPLAFHRQALEQRGVVSARQLGVLQDGRWVRVAGLVLLRQRPSTAKGITFVTLEDETGTINLVLHQAVWQRYYGIARSSNAWIAEGRLERKEAVLHVVVRKLEDLTGHLGPLSAPSRDFR